MNALAWIVRKELLRFAADRAGAILTLALPVLLAALLSLLLAPALGPLRVDVLVVDRASGEDPRTASLLEALEARESVTLERVDEATARERVAEGRAAVAVILPEGTGSALSIAGLTATEVPEIELVYDPSRGAEVDLVAGLLLETSLDEILSRARGGGEGTLPSLRAPLSVSRTALSGPTGGRGAFNIHAHLFAGMLSMFVLFMAMEQARHLAAERREGTLTRLRLTGAPRWAILAGTAVSTTLLALVLSALVYGTGMLLFDIEVRGAALGFVAVLVAQACFAGGFALLLAGLARSERQLVNTGTAAILILSFVGGAWIPAFLMPGWLDAAGVVVPTWWANHGLAAMTWRGASLSAAWPAALALLVMAVSCGALGMARFQWLSRRRSTGR